MPKILHIIPSLKFGGAERFLLDIYPLLSKKFNHVICPFVHTGEFYTDEMHFKKLKNNRFWIYIFKSDAVIAKILKPLLLFYYTYRARKILIKEKPTTIITYTTIAAIALRLALFTTQKQKITWYCRIGGHVIVYLPPFSHYKRIYRKLLSIYHFFIKMCINRADCVIVVSQILMNELITVCHAHTNKFFLLPGCLSNSTPCTKKAFEDEISDFSKYQPFFITAGRLEQIKGYDFLIKAFAIFVKDRPEVKLIILGNGSQRNSLEKLIKSLNLEKKVFLPGFVKNPEKNFPLAIAYIASSRSEGCSKAILEAMQTASLIISSNEGARGIITHNVNGILFESENSASLLSAINSALEMPEKNKATLKNNAYQESLAYSPQRIAALLNTKLEMNYNAN